MMRRNLIKEIRFLIIFETIDLSKNKSKKNKNIVIVFETKFVIIKMFEDLLLKALL